MKNMDVEQYILDIQEKLKEQNYYAKKIDYIELQELHQKYGSQISEKEFALYVLELSISMYNVLKSGKSKATILRIRLDRVIEENSSEIKEKLVSQGYAGKSINYTEMQSLHQKYGKVLPERDFALHILEISVNSYNGLRTGKYKTAILQSRLDKFIEENVQEIKDKLFSQGYAGKLVDYAELQELHQIYGKQMPEATFAKEILGIVSASYYRLKAGKRKVYILRDLQKESDENIENIREKLRIDGYVGRIINYLELKNLHITYGKEFTESRFAQIVLEIPEGSYLSAKNHNTNVIVLNRLAFKTPENEIEDIKERLKEQGYVCKSIDYVELQTLHQTYGKQMLEREFAQKVLGITYCHYNNLRNNSKKRAIILKSLKPPRTSIEEINRIKEQIKAQGNSNEVVDYERLTKTSPNIWKWNDRKRIC
jgi:hypothetical protein